MPPRGGSFDYTAGAVLELARSPLLDGTELSQSRLLPTSPVFPGCHSVPLTLKKTCQSLGVANTVPMTRIPSGSTLTYGCRAVGGGSFPGGTTPARPFLLLTHAKHAFELIALLPRNSFYPLTHGYRKRKLGWGSGRSSPPARRSCSEPGIEGGIWLSLATFPARRPSVVFPVSQHKS